MSLLKLKEVEALPIDSPERTVLHGEIIRSKPFLQRLYVEWYQLLRDAMNYHDGDTCLELGSGAGFVKEVMPDVTTSDVMDLPGVDKVFYAEDIPFDDSVVDGIMMIDVLHHIPKPESFFGEAVRVLKPGGRIVMSEPWNSVFGRFIYKNFHHEPFDTEGGWTIPSTGPLSGANGALPWILFERDRLEFEQKFPELVIKTIKYHTPFRYLMSGGVSMKQLVPNFLFKPITFLEKIVTSRYLNMFALIVIEKRDFRG